MYHSSLHINVTNNVDLYKMKLLIAIFILSLCACQSQKAQPANTKVDQANLDEICLSFDQRQCQTDAFAKYLPQEKSSDAMFVGMQTYLAEQNIKVLHMRIDMNFHEITCAACDVCPEQHRFFLSLPKSEAEKVQNLNLLNLTDVDCQEHF